MLNGDNLTISVFAINACKKKKKIRFSSERPLYLVLSAVTSSPKLVFFLYSICFHPIYVVWQKSNEADFLLTMNFILFTNQGYPLQNSSLGQLHSNRGVSIVRSSAGRLLLVYLSAFWLRSSGYYPEYQNGALSSGF